MSDWVVDDSSNEKTTQKISNPSDWVIDNEESTGPSEKESLGYSLAAAPFRALSDLVTSGYQGVQSIPGMMQSARTEIPGAYQTLRHHPLHALSQAGAGLTELGHGILNTPKGIADYSANRLNLIPQSWAQEVPYQKDISHEINQLFGEPNQPGDELLRGAARNAPIASGIGSALSSIGRKATNPLVSIYKASKNEPIPHEIPEKPSFKSFEPSSVTPPTYPEPESYEPISPIHGNALIDELGGGAVNKEEGSRKLADFIRNAHDIRVEQSAPFFQHTMDLAGKEKLYEHVDPLISTKMNEEMHMMNKIKDLKIPSLYAIFKNSPTIENAHSLKTELGSVLGDL